MRITHLLVIGAATALAAACSPSDRADNPPVDAASNHDAPASAIKLNAPPQRQDARRIASRKSFPLWLRTSQATRTGR